MFLFLPILKYFRRSSVSVTCVNCMPLVAYNRIVTYFLVTKRVEPREVITSLVEPWSRLTGVISLREAHCTAVIAISALHCVSVKNSVV